MLWSKGPGDSETERRKMMKSPNVIGQNVWQNVSAVSTQLIVPDLCTILCKKAPKKNVLFQFV